MPLWPKFLITPEHAFHVQSPEALVARVYEQMATGREYHPHLIWPDPWMSLDSPTVYVNCGRWMVSCRCGDCPMVHPVWRMAACFGCGAIYRNLQIPPNAAAIEAVLAERASPIHRNWNWPQPETVDDLIAQNREQGDGVPLWHT